MTHVAWASLFTLGLFVAVGNPLSHPASECETIKTPDERAFCRAVTSGDAAYCETIRNEQRRAMCRAEARAGTGSQH